MKQFAAFFLLLLSGLQTGIFASPDSSWSWRAGEKISIPQIIFEGSSVKLTDAASDSLLPLRDFLLQHPDFRVEIGSHFKQGSDVNYARNITQLRAQACCDKLVSWNIPPQQISAHGYGMSKPLLRSARESAISQKLPAKTDERIEAKISAVIRQFSDSIFNPGDIIILPWEFVPVDSKTKKDTLQRIAQILRADTSRRIEIGVFTDDRGNDVMNRQLSEARAKSIYELLIQQYAVSKTQLRFNGYGETVPLVTDKQIKAGTHLQQQQWNKLNKRIELKFYQ